MKQQRKKGKTNRILEIVQNKEQERKKGKIRVQTRSFIIFTLHNKLLCISNKGDYICVACRKQWRNEKCEQNIERKVKS
jgi:hypothetical protein